MRIWMDKPGALFLYGMRLLRRQMARFIREEKGDLVSSLGWMALMALALVLVKSIVDGGITAYANNIFSHLDRIFGP